jgi:imidazolonepropionase-like amidohydrolase
MHEPPTGLRAYRADLAFDGDRVLSDGPTVFVDGRSIVGVEAGHVELPADCDLTYVPGGTLLPGLIDTHVHLCADSTPGNLDRLPEVSPAELDVRIDAALQRHVRAGVTAVRDLGDIGWVVLGHRDTGPGLPHVVAAGPPITSIAGHCASMGGGVAGVNALRDAVRERAERGADLVKIMASGGFMTTSTDVLMPQFSADELRAAVDEAHERGLAVTAHAHALAAVRGAVRAGVDGVEHCSCLSEQGMRTPTDLAADLVARQVTVCPTLGHQPGFGPPPHLLATLDRLGVSFAHIVAHAGELHAAGVRLVSGSDAGIGPGKPHGVLPESVITYVDGGASPEEALASATGLAADACGLSDRTGRLRPGLAADLLLVGGDAIADITRLREPTVVVARGVEVLGGRVSPG